jgi:hypothetical protein
MQGPLDTPLTEMNSLTRSCMQSLASFAIFALLGKATFVRITSFEALMTGAKFLMLASDSTNWEETLPTETKRPASPRLV